MINKKAIHRSENLSLIGAALLSAGFIANLPLIWIAGAAFLITGIVLFVVTFRCPYCKRFLRRNPAATGEKRCNHCGKKILFKK